MGHGAWWNGTKLSYLLRQAGGAGGAGGDKESSVFKVITVVKITNDYSLLPQPPQLIFVTFGHGETALRRETLPQATALAQAVARDERHPFAESVPEG
jgi:hypothetical protein